MYVRLTTDKSYPVEIFDSWGGVVSINHIELEEEEEWNEFIHELEAARKVYLSSKESRQ